MAARLPILPPRNARGVPRIPVTAKCRNSKSSAMSSDMLNALYSAKDREADFAHVLPDAEGPREAAPKGDFQDPPKGDYHENEKMRLLRIQLNHAAYFRQLNSFSLFKPAPDGPLPKVIPSMRDQRLNFR